MKKYCMEPECSEYGKPKADSCGCEGQEMSEAVAKAMNYFRQKCAEYDAEKKRDA